MKQIRTGLLLAVACFPTSVALSQTSDTSVMFNKENRHTVMMSVERPEKEAREALRLRLERSGLKERIVNNVAMYKDVVFPEISPEKIDIYTKVDKGPYNSSVVYMAVSRKNRNFTHGSFDSTLTVQVKTFLQSFTGDANRYSDNADISNQMDDITKEEKYYSQLLDEQTDLKKKRQDIDDKLLEIQNNLLLKRELIDKKKLAVQNARTKLSKQ
ncbi:hypothetical protein [Pseudobacter ginsenosidimutans]|uniref:DUF4468 domain-containing protein n=1 Tax=Pseudobacter ginsenosidimutans TaxID=661488 RepID=A0A4Q7N2V3_9BACT|nr:hypothetical protein [Pseudobacter ginsenosidimutans]QEC43157.1 hypothetical protein FSB84_16180 [Pseudobacter ginsenosidimutans]RZS74515.1 hypothetical protein EV199_0363 [Pseudobacter ginsenosidimutans]